MTTSVYSIPPLEFKVNCGGDSILLNHTLLYRSPWTLFHTSLIADDPAIRRLVALVFWVLWLGLALEVGVILIV